MSTTYSLSATLAGSITEVDPIVRKALQQEGFGIISEIDISAKLTEKLGVEHPPHLILGACNPGLAHKALEENVDVALALPCNVVLREEGESTIVSALLPSVALKPFQGIKVQESSCTAEAALTKVFDSLTRHSL